MAKSQTPAAHPAASEKQQPEMREIIRQIKKVKKAYQTMSELGMKAQLTPLQDEIVKLREYAIKRFEKELDEACSIETK